MNDLKERFDHLEINPDPKVWDSINDTLRRRAVARRRVAIGASSAVVAAAAVFAFVTFNRVNTSPVSAAPAVAENITVTSPDMHTSSESLVATVGNDKATQAPVSAVDNSATVPSAVVLAESETSLAESAPVSQPTAPSASSQSQSSVRTVAPSVSPVAAASVPVVESVSSDETDNDKVETININTNTDNKSSASDLVVWIPNAFAPDDPNGDVRLFKVSPNTSATIVSYEIYIYSRGGRMVYHSKDINQGWDGSANGRPQPMGTYVYVIQVNDAVTGLQHYKGTVTLIR